MKTWTEQAEVRLAQYLDERVRREGFSGEEAEELRSDLLSHVHEEAEKDQAPSIGLMQLEGILSHLDAGYRFEDAPYRPSSSRSEFQPPETPPGRHPWQTKRWLFGVALPLGVTIFEAVIPFCGSVFFDPLATGWHLLLALMVPVVNAWLLLGAPRGSERWKGVAMGFALVIAIFYALLFVPLVPASLVALIFFGLGLLSLMPLLAAIVTWKISRSAAKESADLPRFRRGRRAGVAAGLLALVLLEGPAFWTRTNLAAAANERNPGAERQAAVARLRHFHSERTLLLACYEGSRGSSMATDISGWICRGSEGPAKLFNIDDWDLRPGGGEGIRDVFFRVTGRSFSDVEPPRTIRQAAFGMGRGRDFQEVSWDSHLGGDQVATRVRDLDLAESRFDGHVDNRSRIGYGEWTMVFKNHGWDAKEARCQVLLPRDGRVSRLTLWVNGEPREAAFSSVSKVKAAYKEVAVVQRRDPVLVTMCGPDTVLVQCFPVPANGEMKIRFGITAPVTDGQWELPRILERNFGTTDTLEHAVWLQGDTEFDLLQAGSEVKLGHRDGDGFSISADLSADAAMGQAIAVRVNGLPPHDTLWCEDKFAPAYERFLIREPHPKRKPAAKVQLVIDGSATMEEAKPWIEDVLKKFPGGSFPILLADDTARSVTGIGDYHFSGGRDNEPALREAVRRVKAGEVDEIVWLHGPQSVGLAQSEALIQLIERGTRRPVIHTVMAVKGPNRLAESLQRSGALRRGPALFEPRRDLYDFLTLLTSEHEEAGWHWKRSPQAPADLGTPVWDHLARQWAIESVESARSEVAENERPALAAKYQLVTSMSGAVVLETKEQYERNGLTPVDANAAPQIPGVPEPSTVLLVMISAGVGLMRRKRHGNENAA